MVDAVADLDRGRQSYARQAWTDAYVSLSAADHADALSAEDLELLATSVYMLGREEEYLTLLGRAYGTHLDAGDCLAALRCAFWVGVHLAQRGEMGGASGWLGRAQRLLEREGEDRVERGYLLLPSVFAHEARGELEAAAAAAGEAAAIGQRFGDADLFALAAHMQGHMLIEHGRLEDGLVLLDEAMVAAATGELSPIVTGIVYCGVILACQVAHEMRRAREWTAALSRWCERQPDLVSFTGRCLVHRAEIMQLEGRWAEALEEARRAAERCEAGGNRAATAEAFYRQGEIHRLRGDHVAAEQGYREASRRGREPQPGVALLRLAQGERGAAVAAIRGALAGTPEPGMRVALLPACVEVMLAAAELEEARAACEELARLTEAATSPALGAIAAHARGALELASGDPGAALVALRRAGRAWQELDAPYEAARTRELAGLACRALGDDDGAALELEAARETFQRLGAAPDLVRLDARAAAAAGRDAHGLSERELEVLRMVAAGATNKAIAAKLVISVRTVDRHLSNIFAKLGVSSRAAATSYAHEHRLL